MSLSRIEVENLIRLVWNTEEQELNCEQCLSLVAEFAEQELHGLKTAEALTVVEQHLSVCAECREEYEMLLRTLREMGDGMEDV